MDETVSAIVTFKHFRMVRGKLAPYSRSHKHGHRDQPESKGGMTFAIVKYPDVPQLFVGCATCSERDNFCYSLGRNVALSNAVAQYITYKETHGGF